jgi:hypothetical protein
VTSRVQNRQGVALSHGGVGDSESSRLLRAGAERLKSKSDELEGAGKVHLTARVAARSPEIETRNKTRVLKKHQIERDNEDVRQTSTRQEAQKHETSQGDKGKQRETSYDARPQRTGL